MQTGSSIVSRAPRPSSLADVLDLILDKGLVVDAYVRVSLAGIELLTVDARVVVASVDTYLRFAEAVNRLDLGQTEQKGLPELFGQHDEDEHDETDDRHSGNGTPDRRKRSESSSSSGDGREAGRRGREEKEGAGHRQDRTSREVTAGGGDEPGVLERIAERARR